MSLWAGALYEKARAAGLDPQDARAFVSWAILKRPGSAPPDDLVADRSLRDFDRILDEWKETRPEPALAPRGRRRYRKKRQR